LAHSFEVSIFLSAIIQPTCTEASMGLFTKRMLTVLGTGSNHQKEPRTSVQSQYYPVWRRKRRAKPHFHIGVVAENHDCFREFVYHYEQKNLPEDVYLFDASLAWTIVLTHEPQNEHGWKCLTISL
jgi:hypothetical protein